MRGQSQTESSQNQDKLFKTRGKASKNIFSKTETTLDEHKTKTGIQNIFEFAERTSEKTDYSEPLASFALFNEKLEVSSQRLYILPWKTIEKDSLEIEISVYEKMNASHLPDVYNEEKYIPGNEIVLKTFHTNKDLRIINQDTQYIYKGIGTSANLQLSEKDLRQIKNENFLINLIQEYAE